MKASGAHINFTCLFETPFQLNELFMSLASISSCNKYLFFLDAQQARIVKLGESITEHESVVKDIQTTLSYHEKELIKLDELQLLAGILY